MLEKFVTITSKEQYKALLANEKPLVLFYVTIDANKKDLLAIDALAASDECKDI